MNQTVPPTLTNELAMQSAGISCCAFKLYVEGGQDAHPTKVKIYLTLQFKCGLAYHNVREMFGLSAQLAIHAIRRVSGNRKTAKKDGKPVNKFAPTSVTYDTRIFSFREKDWTVSLTTTGGRERFVLAIGNYQLGLLKGQNPKTATLCKRKMAVTILIFSLNLSQPSLHLAIKFWVVTWVGLILRSLLMEIHLAANKLPKLKTIMPS